MCIQAFLEETFLADTLGGNVEIFCRHGKYSDKMQTRHQQQYFNPVCGRHKAYQWGIAQGGVFDFSYVLSNSCDTKNVTMLMTQSQIKGGWLVHRRDIVSGKRYKSFL